MKKLLALLLTMIGAASAMKSTDRDSQQMDSTPQKHTIEQKLETMEQLHQDRLQKINALEKKVDAETTEVQTLRQEIDGVKQQNCRLERLLEQILSLMQK